MEHLAQKVEQLENMLHGLIEKLFGCTPSDDVEDSVAPQEEEHFGETCEQAHPDASHEEWAHKRQRGEN